MKKFSSDHTKIFCWIKTITSTEKIVKICKSFFSHFLFFISYQNLLKMYNYTTTVLCVKIHPLGKVSAQCKAHSNINTKTENSCVIALQINSEKQDLLFLFFKNIGMKTLRNFIC